VPAHAPGPALVWKADIGDNVRFEGALRADFSAHVRPGRAERRLAHRPDM